ncbi:helix-turn-helix domain-containing protein [uncultured Erythrobacter sp.]|uniref:helix-turn-helix domain-containing protein n=1 Tax=uncultured Erythrobacter sp. TaxID=263913 RepID=UPI00261EFB3E|nr:helix-turn-helix transcriptional regulator [uncultured Erythrobacter sp.]
MGFGVVLARLRRARGWSQEELAHKAELSQRHVSFLETGRSQPGRAALAKLTKAMALKGWEQRSLMRSLTDEPERPQPERAPTALPEGFLERLSIWPACTFKSDGSLVQSNTALDTLLDYASGGKDLWGATAAVGVPNLYDLVFHPKGLIRWMINPEAVIPETLRRLRIEASHKPTLNKALSRFEGYPSVQKWGAGLGDPPAVLAEAYRLPMGKTLTVVSVLSSIASPGEYDLASLRIETFVPADGESAKLLSSLARPTTLPAI